MEFRSSAVGSKLRTVMRPKLRPVLRPEVLQRVSCGWIRRHEHFRLIRIPGSVLYWTNIVRNRRDLVWDELLKPITWRRSPGRYETVLGETRTSLRKVFSTIRLTHTQQQNQQKSHIHFLRNSEACPRVPLKRIGSCQQNPDDQIVCR